MRSILVLLLCLPFLVNAQDNNGLNLKDLFKFSTVYGAVNGGNSLSDRDVFSVNTGMLDESVVETPFDYSIIFGIRKIKRLGYEPKERFKNGTENSFSDAATIGLWENKLEFLLQAEYKRQQGQNFLDQQHFIRYVADKWMVKAEYLVDGFADVKYFESSQRYRQDWKGLSFNVGVAQRIAEPYGYNPLEDWMLSNNNLHYTDLALQEGYTVEFDGMGGEIYYDPSGNEVATSTEVWEAVVIPEVLSNYSDRKRNELDWKLNHSVVLGVDYYKYSKKFWLHGWANVLPYHLDTGDEYSYHKYNGGQWIDYSGGMVFGYWISKNLGLFVEGKYNKYWNRTWHNFSAGVNYRIF